ncbi:MAG TPA: ABC transporter ATP-binding protein [Burkholderiaceae bacterium]|nr:ABC transporter ATP-binding protein [Burkholderiaceae bacterium]
MSAAVIDAANLTKRYGATTAVDGISFSVGAGEIFGLLGPNGAGKTTTILMLLGLTEITDGSVRVLGLDPRREPLTIKQHLGYLPDSVGFYNQLSALDNLFYTARLLGIPAAQRLGRIHESLERVGLADAGHKRVSAFSHGMRQRLGLAEIIMKRARVAILDEPTSGLDPQATEDFLRLIRTLKADGVTVLLSSHLLDHMQRICDRVALFQQGRIALMGTVPELARQVLGDGFEVEVEVSGERLADSLARVEGVSAVETIGADRYRLRANRDVRADAARAAVQAGGALRRLSIRDPSLDAIYNSYFQRPKVKEADSHAT